MADRNAELLFQRNQLADILKAIPDVVHRAYRPPVIDVSAVFESESSVLQGVEDDLFTLVPGLKAFESSIEREIIALDKVRLVICFIRASGLLNFPVPRFIKSASSGKGSTAFD